MHLYETWFAHWDHYRKVAPRANLQYHVVDICEASPWIAPTLHIFARIHAGEIEWFQPSLAMSWKEEKTWWEISELYPFIKVTLRNDRDWSHARAPSLNEKREKLDPNITHWSTPLYLTVLQISRKLLKCSFLWCFLGTLHIGSVKPCWFVSTLVQSCGISQFGAEYLISCLSR